MAPPDFTDSRLLWYILIIVVVNFKVCEISEISWPPQGFLGSSTYVHTRGNLLLATLVVTLIL